MQHTPQSPNKNRVRRNWLMTVPRSKDVITISHGALEALMMMRWEGRIQVCDIDPGVIESTRYMRDSEYKDLCLLPPWCIPIQEMVLDYCTSYGGKKLGVIDIDLAFCLDQCLPILQSVLDTLRLFGIHTKVLLTFRNGRDGFSSTEGRMIWLKQNLGKGVEYVTHEQYNSSRIRENASRHKGSAMCIVTLQT
jgi:hypothetical protein